MQEARGAAVPIASLQPSPPCPVPAPVGGPCSSIATGSSSTPSPVAPSPARPDRSPSPAGHRWRRRGDRPAAGGRRQRGLVVTNQPDVRRGALAIEALEEMHVLLQAQLEFDDVVACPHDGHAGCRCRKPLPGLLVELGVVRTSTSRRAGSSATAGSISPPDVWRVPAPSWSTAVQLGADRRRAHRPPLTPDQRVADVTAAARAIPAIPGRRSPSDRSRPTTVRAGPGRTAHREREDLRRRRRPGRHAGSPPSRASPGSRPTRR